MLNSPLQAQIKSLPNLPGVYQFYDINGRLLYVGKAKNIAKRVSSYFSKRHDSYRLRVMVRNIERIKPIVVETESDALLLENNLIKTHQPKFNILLKDDKTFPWVCIKNEAFPRVFTTRRKINDGSKYFGPFTSMRTIKTLLSVVRKIYPLRTCNYDLKQEKIAAGKFKRCLEFHLGNCLAPCESLQTKADYEEQIARVEDIIKGNFKPVFAQLEKEMQTHAKALAFEEAQRVKTKIETLKNYQSKSTVVNPRINDVDVFSIYADHTHAYVNYLQVTHGSITRSYTLELKKKLEENDRQLLELAVTELRQRFESDAKHLILPFKIDLPEALKITIPKLGDKKKLLELSLKNTLEYKQERLKQIKLTDPDAHANRILMQMKKDLSLTDVPRHIECFDNSNIQGSNPVAACVVFKNAKPSKADYRHFNIKSV
ncbi:MAG: excinuclease ABC subunit UvrC, partial [Flavobacteriaceae bacterium]|nr:excinuclease ABC subunit UvrC [Flavobacteriaceae bacterium]